MAEWRRSMSHPNKTLKGSPWATKNTIGIPIPLLVTFIITCRLTVLFCLPVAPIIVMLWIGNVGILSVRDSRILFNSVLSISDMLAPVSIIIFVSRHLVVLL